MVSLSDEDIAQLRAELSGGRPPMVWFTPAAVGVEAGASAKLVAFDEPADGDYIQVRPTGSRDVLSFSPSELTRIRPPRKKAAKPAPAMPAAARPPEPAPVPPRPAATPPKPAAAPRPAPAPKPAATPKPAAAARQPGQRRATKAKAPAAPKPAVEVAVTLRSNPAGEWSVEVTVGKKRAVRPTPVPPADVAKAARELPAGVAEAVDRALESARRQQQDRVATLQAELERAERALRDLG